MTGIIKTDQIQGAGSSTVTIPTGNTLNVVDNLTVDTNTLHVDASNNKVGIGTTSPAETLEVVHATAPAIQLNRTNDGGFKSILRQQGNDFEIRGSSGSTKIYTGNADGDSSTARLTIDASGRVNMASQPSFLAKLSGVNPDMFSNPVPFNHAVHNTGSHYNTSTYKFTAPVAGRYYLSYSVRVNHTTSGHIIHPCFQINGTNDGASLTIHKNDTTGQYMHTSFSYVRNLSASDYLTLNMSNGNNGGGTMQDGQCSFSGHLLG